MYSNLPRLGTFCIDTVSSLTAKFCVVPLETPLTHSGLTAMEKALIPWLLTVSGMVQVTRMLVALRERALVAIDSGKD